MGWIRNRYYHGCQSAGKFEQRSSGVNVIQSGAVKEVRLRSAFVNFKGALAELWLVTLNERITASIYSTIACQL